MTRFVLTAVLLLAASAAGAQTTRFADAGAVADILPYGNALAAFNPGVTAAFGGTLPNRWTVRFEATVPWWKEDSYAYDCCPSGSGDHHTSNSRYRLDTYAVLAGREYPVARRVTFAPLTGLSVVNAHYESDVTITARDGRSVTHRSSETQNSMLAWSLGADVAVAATPRLAIVPQVRLHIAPNYESATVAFRPAIAARFSF